MKQFTNKVAVITGAAGGIGLALAGDFFRALYSLDEAVAPPLRQGLWHAVRQNTSLRGLIKDGWAVARALK